MTTQKQEPTSREERFFGVNSEVSFDDDEKDGLEVEIEQEEEEIEASEEQPEGEEKPGGKKKYHEMEDGELEKYTKGVQKRIDQLTYEKNEERRMRDEAIRFAQGLQNQNREYERLLTDGEATFVQRIKKAAEDSVASAEREFKAAYEAGDSEAMLAANRKLIQAQAEFKEATNHENDYNRRRKTFDERQWQPGAPFPGNQPPQQQPQHTAQPQIPKPSDRALKWAEKNSWFEDRVDMRSYAFGMHELLKQKGVKPDTDEYYEAIDEAVRDKFPEYFVKKKKHQPSPVVAPSSRDNGAKTRQVRLSPSAAKVADLLGVSHEQYAEQVLKLKQ